MADVDLDKNLGILVEATTPDTPNSYVATPHVSQVPHVMMPPT